MTDIIKEVQEEPRQTQEEPKEAVSDEHVVAKAKAKRASRAKPKEVLTLPGVDPREPKEEPNEEPKEEHKEEPKEVPKGEEKIACSDCGKQVSAKTLKYSHGPNCNCKKQKTKTEVESQPKIQRVLTLSGADQREAITEELIEHHIRTQSRAERATRRETMMNKLMQTAF